MASNTYPLVIKEHQISMSDDDQSWRALAHLLFSRSELTELFREAENQRRLQDEIDPPHEVNHESVPAWVLRMKLSCVYFMDICYKIWLPIIILMYIMSKGCSKNDNCDDCDMYEQVLYYSVLTLIYKTLGCTSFFLTLVINE